MTDQWIVGLTGGIASGKSVAGAHLKKKGLNIVDADIIARQVVAPGEYALVEIANHFGQDIIGSDGQLKRSELREIIFASAAARRWLEALLHPLMRAQIEPLLHNKDTDYSVLISPLLLETSQRELVNRVLVIDAPEALQISRGSDRDAGSNATIEKIISTQLSRSKRRALADDVICNDEDLDNLYRSLDALHLCYLEMSAGHQAIVK